MRAQPGRSYDVCNGHGRIEIDERCRSRHIPADQLGTLVWDDLCDVVCHPDQIAAALKRAQAGAWLPDELQARRARLQTACAQNERYQQRLLDAYLHGVLELEEFTRKRQDLQQQAEMLRTQQQQLDATAQRHVELATLASSIEAFCHQVQAGLESATFEQRRALVELLIDRVIVTNDDVEIRYVVPTSPDGPHHNFFVSCEQTIYHYVRLWRIDGTWEVIHDAVREQVRERAGRNREPSAGIIDSESVKTTEKGGREATTAPRS